jgi:hypothetical protein
MTIARTVAFGALAFSAARVGAQGTIAGTVYDSLTLHAPAAGATVVLVELSRYATTDAHGRFRLDGVPAGHYTLGFNVASLDALEVALPAISVEVADRGHSAVALATPSAATIYMLMCRAPLDRDTGIIIGRIRDVDDDMPLAGATISTDWTEVVFKGGRSATNRVYAAAKTDSRGRYLLCGVPAHVALDVSSEHDGFTAGPTSLTMDSSLIRRVDFSISRRDIAARAVSQDGLSQSHSASRGTASLRGTVLGGDGRPLAGAVVGIVGSSDSARTDTAGAFHLDRIPAGTRSVQARSIGLLPTTVSMDFATNAVRDTTLSLTHKAQTLAPVSVEGRAATSWMELSGFDTRRKQGLGAFMTEEEIARHNYLDMISILRSMRGVHVEYVRRSGLPPIPMPLVHGGTSLTNAYCIPNFFLDGAEVKVAGADDFDQLSSFLNPKLVRGIEVYSAPGTLPAQYDRSSTTGCGSIVIWTH